MKILLTSLIFLFISTNTISGITFDKEYVSSILNELGLLTDYVAKKTQLSLLDSLSGTQDKLSIESGFRSAEYDLSEALKGSPASFKTFKMNLDLAKMELLKNFR